MTESRIIARWAAPALLAGGALLLSACGGDSSSSTQPAANAAGKTVSVSQVSGVGKTLTDAKGKTLYTAEQEKSGKILCTGDCVGFWMPVTIKGSNQPTGPSSVQSDLGTVQRPDDSATQVTFKGAPLYTFKLDTSAGSAKGDGFKDSFSGHDFTWHAATIGASSGGGSGGSNGGGGRGGYGY